MNVKDVFGALRSKIALLKRFSVGRIIGVTLAAAAALVLVCTVGLGIFLSSFDVNGHKPKIAAAVKKATGRDLEIQGNMSISFFPTLGIKTGKAVLHDTASFGPAPLLAVDNASLVIGLMPFLRGDMDVEQIYLHNPSLKLLTNALGEHNWEAGFAASPGGEAAADSSDLSLHVKKIIVGELKLLYSDERDGAAWSGTADAFTLTRASSGKELKVKLSGQVKDERSSRRATFSMKAGLNSPGKGVAAVRFENLDIVAKGYTGEELTIKTTGLFTYDRKPTAGAAFSDFAGTLHMPAPPTSEEEPEEGKEFLASFSGGNLAITPASGATPESWRGRITFAELDLDELLGRINPSYAGFAGESSRGAPNLSRPVISKSVRGTQIAVALQQTGASPGGQPRQSADISPPGDADAPDNTAEQNAEEQPSASASGRPFPVVNFTFAANTLIFKGMPFKQLDIVISSRNSRSEAHCTGRLFGGSVSGIGAADFGQEPPAVTLNGTASGINLEEATKLLADNFVVSGVLEAALNAEGGGSSFAEVAGSLKGKASVRVPSGGVIRGFGMIPETAREAKYVPQEFPYDRFIASADISEGIASCKEVTLVSRALDIKGGGKVHFAYGQVDFGLDIIPPGKGPIPIVVTGPYKSLSCTIATKQGRLSRNLKPLPGERYSGRGGGAYSPPPRQRGPVPSGGASRPPARAPQKRSHDILRDAGGMLFR